MLQQALELAPRSPDTGRFHENRARVLPAVGTADTDGSVDIHPWVSHNTTIHKPRRGLTRPPVLHCVLLFISPSNPCQDER